VNAQRVHVLFVILNNFEWDFIGGVPGLRPWLQFVKLSNTDIAERIA